MAVTGAYQDTYRRSIEDPQGFWAEVADQIEWFRQPVRILDDTNPPFYRWFVGGELNTCYNALDRHVLAGRAEQLALVYDSPVTTTIKQYTYRELRDQVAQFAGVLSGLGVGRGDRVVIYMPMVPEAVIAMLASARVGAVHSVVFGGFASHELAVRIDDAKPKLVISASCGIEPTRIVEYKPLLDRAIEIAQHKPERCVILQREQAHAELLRGRDLDWMDVAASAAPADCIPVKATDPLYILYTSGTTASPKGVLRDNGGHAVALRWSLPNIYDTHPGEVFWAASDVGWVVGHSYIVYAPLLTGCTTILYEGKPVGTPNPGAFWRVISQHKVKTLFTAPTAFRAIKKEDPKGKHLPQYDLSTFEYLFLAGERLDPDTYRWASELLKIPVIDHWWQTETGWPVAANCVGIETVAVKPGSSTRAVPGYEIRVLDTSGQAMDPASEGALVINLPLPPGTLQTLWGNDERYVQSYLSDFPGCYLTGDGGRVDEDGYVWVMGRIDDVINVAGHRLSTGAMEAALATHPDVAECAVVGVADQIKGQVPIGFVVLKAGVMRQTDEIESDLVEIIRNDVGAFASFRHVVIVDRLPKTRSGKIVRGTIRKIADNEEYVAPATIDDPIALDEIRTALEIRRSAG